MRKRFIKCVGLTFTPSDFLFSKLLHAERRENKQKKLRNAQTFDELTSYWHMNVARLEYKTSTGITNKKLKLKLKIKLK